MLDESLAAEAGIQIWKVARLPVSGVPHLRFTSRKDPLSGRAWSIGIIIDQQGALIVSSPFVRQTKAAAILSCVNEAIGSLAESGYSGPLEISVQSKDFEPEKITSHSEIRHTVLEGSDISPIAPANAEDILRSLVDDDDADRRAARLKAWHQRMSGSPEMIFKPIDDHFCQIKESTPPPVPAHFDAPVTAIVGLAGAGKSSLISGLLGLAGEDLPPTGASRTTLCPIAFRNTADSSAFHLDVVFHSKNEILRRIGDRLTEGLEIAMENDVTPDNAFAVGSPEVKALVRSPDALFDLRFTLGRVKPDNDRWTSIIETLRSLLGLVAEKGLSENEIHEFGLTDPLAEEIWAGIEAYLGSLGFGRIHVDPTGALRFSYSTMSRKAAVEAGRRFYAVGMKYAGKSFGPFCARITLSGPWISAPSFEIVDNRGFDHEGSLERMAGDDLFAEIAAADRVLVVESAEKAGDRQTMGLVARIISDGEGEKVLFACTRADILLTRGVEVEEHVSNGILNGLHTLDQAVGQNAVQAVRDTVRVSPPFILGNLHKAYTLGNGGILLAERDEEIDLDTGREVGRLLRSLCAFPGTTSADGMDLLLEYSGKKLEAALAAAWEHGFAQSSIIYGLEGGAKGTLHWASVKREVRIAVKKTLELGEAVSSKDMTLLSEYSREMSQAVSRVLDDPIGAKGQSTDGASQEDVRTKANFLRRSLRPVIEQAVVRRIFSEHLESWVVARDYSMTSYGPGSTRARAAKICQILQTSSKPLQAKGFSETIRSNLVASGGIIKGNLNV